MQNAAGPKARPGPSNLPSRARRAGRWPPAGTGRPYQRLHRRDDAWQGRVQLLPGDEQQAAVLPPAEQAVGRILLEPNRRAQ